MTPRHSLTFLFLAAFVLITFARTITAADGLSGLSDPGALTLTSDYTSTSLGRFDAGSFTESGVGASIPDVAIGTGAASPPLDPVVPVPEPSTWVTGALALLGVAFIQRRRLRTLIARCA